VESVEKRSIQVDDRRVITTTVQIAANTNVPTPIVAATKPNQSGVPMSECLHCDIHEILEVQLQDEHADLAEVTAKVTEVLADLILMAPPDEQCMMMADVVANLGGMVLEKSREADSNSPRRSSH
jgi:hypothetical protein